MPWSSSQATLSTTCAWVDNSEQIANKRGAGRLRHVSGKLLWCQDKVAGGTMEVKQIIWLTLAPNPYPSRG